MNSIIDTTSYTSKDFREVFAELLQLVPELTNKWDPNASNEADPGVVLLKLSAFIADKLNYNIDKNVLEAFPSSVTQRGNAQKLYNLLGYDLQYYKSATVPVTLRYSRNGNENGIDGTKSNSSNYTIPKFTELTDDTSSVVFTLLDDVTVALDGAISNAGTAIEGSIHTFTINGSDVITVGNLDSDNRIYLNESMIPSNGLFIYNHDDSSSDFWSAVSNLNATALGNKVYKFGVLPQSGTVYVEFPQDAAQVFGSGICIKYVTTQGERGNISAYTLTQLNGECRIENLYLENSDSPDVDVSLYTLVNNSVSCNNGADPETLENAYKNFKRVVNTFDTCVTRQDYENVIVTSDSVSNAIVSDRTTDLNYSYKVKTGMIEGNNSIVLNYVDELKGDPLMNVFDISVYGLNFVPSTVDAATYNKGFETSHSTEKAAQNVVENVKSLQHSWKLTTSDENSVNEQDEAFKDKIKPFMFKNMYKLDGKILTYQKVTDKEASEIELNVQKALFTNYNARNIEFGQEITYDELLSTIRGADKRIKDVLLNTPSIETVVMDSNNVCYNLSNKDDSKVKTLLVDIIAKSILAGVTPYCIRNVTTTPKYFMAPLKTSPTVEGSQSEELKEQLARNVIEDVTAITTAVPITVNNAGVTLKKNETIQLYAPNYISVTSISTYMYAAYVVKNNDDAFVSAGEICKLGASSYLLIGERKSDLVMLASSNDPANTSGCEKAVYVYKTGQYFRPSVELKNCLVGNNVVVDNIVWLETTKSVDIMEKNAVVINEKQNINAVWIVEDPQNRLFKNGETTHILTNNEVFMYTDSKMESLVVLQSGTMITRNETEKEYVCEKPNLNVIQDVSTINSISWKVLDTHHPITTAELEIVTLGEGCTVFLPDSSVTLNNSPVEVPSGFKYKDESGVEHTLTKLPEDDNGGLDSWYGFSRLQLLSSSETVYSVGEAVDKHQITLHLQDNTAVKLAPGTSITTNILTVLSGGDNQSTLDTNGEPVLSVTLFDYNPTCNPIQYVTPTSDVYDNYTDLNVSDTGSKSVNLGFPSVFKDTIVPIALLTPHSDVCAVLAANQAAWELYNCPTVTIDGNVSQYCLKADGTVYYLHIKEEYSSTDRIELYFKKINSLFVSQDVETAYTLRMYPPMTIEGYSKIITEPDFVDNGKYLVLEAIKKLCTIQDGTTSQNISLFNYCYLPQDPIDNPIESSAFFNTSHIYNKYTICQLDTNNIKVVVADQSRI